MIEPCWLNIHDVCAIHGEILATSGGASGILNQGNLESTLNKPKNLYHYGNEVTLYELAASYGYGFVKNHCFVDGNKRSVAEINCEFNNFYPGLHFFRDMLKSVKTGKDRKWWLRTCWRSK